jgi:hypothetical protein
MTKIVKDKIRISELKKNAASMFGNLVKAVVDIEKGVMAVFGELHSDEESSLLDKGSKQENLWGINIYPDLEGKERVEFDSMINLRPSQGNMSRGVDDPKVQKKILEILDKLIEE